MRAILVNPFTREVTAVEGDFGDYRVTQTWLGNGSAEGDKYAPLCSGPRLGERDGITFATFVDDEGLFRPEQAFFKLAGYDSPLAGYMLVNGVNSEGDTVGLPEYCQPETLARHITWIDRATAASSVPPTTIHKLGPDFEPTELVDSIPVQLSEDSPLPTRNSK